MRVTLLPILPESGLCPRAAHVPGRLASVLQHLLTGSRHITDLEAGVIYSLQSHLTVLPGGVAGALVGLPCGHLQGSYTNQQSTASPGHPTTRPQVSALFFPEFGQLSADSAVYGKRPNPVSLICDSGMAAGVSWRLRMKGCRVSSTPQTLVNTSGYSKDCVPRNWASCLV